MQQLSAPTRDDIRFMARAIHLAERGLFTTDPNPRVGCVLVQEGQIVGEGWHRRVGGPHAEIEALCEAGARAVGATAYVTLEPCCHHGKTPPCTEALIISRVSRVVAAMEDPNPRVGGKGLAALRAAGIATDCALLKEEAEALNPGFCKRMRTGRPFIRSKLAMSLDGQTALASGESRWITGDAARRDAHRLRARSSAILTGVDTVVADDPSLTARLETGEDLLQPARIVVDSRLRTPTTAKLLRQTGSAIVVTTSKDQVRILELTEAGAEIVTLESDLCSHRVDLHALGRYLADSEYNEILVEAGAMLNGALLQAGLVDEWVVYMAPCVLGTASRGLFDLIGIERMSDRYELSITDVRQIGKDLRIRLLQAPSLKNG